MSPSAGSSSPYPYSQPSFSVQDEQEAHPLSPPPQDTQFTTLPPRSSRQQHPFLKPSMSSLKGGPNAPFRRPPPDSPIDVSGPSSSSSHGYGDDHDVDDDEDGYETVEEDDDAELMDSFASAFGNGAETATHVTKYGAFARRGVQTQSLLPFPVQRKGSISKSDGASRSQQQGQLPGYPGGSMLHPHNQLQQQYQSQYQHQQQIPSSQGGVRYYNTNISSSSSSPIYHTSDGRRFLGDAGSNSKRPTSLPAASSPSPTDRPSSPPKTGTKEPRTHLLGWSYF